MAYTPATKFPPSMKWFQWSLPTAAAPKLSAPLTSTATTVVWSTPPRDYAGAIITGDFLVGIKRADGYVESIYIPPGKVSVDGLTATDVIRGVRLEGLDFTTGDATKAVSHLLGESVFCNITGVMQACIQAALNGSIATGGTGITIGTDAVGTVTIYRSTGVGTKSGFLRWDTATGKTQASNDGAVWNDIPGAAAAGVASIAKFGSPALVGAVTMTGAGGGVTLNQVGQNIEINVPAGGGGTVTSVDAAAPADVFTVAGGPIVGAGTLTLSKVNQAKNKVYVGPSAGADAAPTFRVLQKEDVQSANAAALLPGAGITITDNGNGTFTIASTGGGSGFGGNSGFSNTPNSDPTSTDWWTTIIPSPFEGSGPSETPWANMSPSPTPKGGGTSSIYGIATAKADLGTNKLANAFIGDNSTIAFFDATHQFIAKYFAQYAVSTGVAEFTGIGFFVGNAMDSNAGKITNAVQDRIVITSYNGAFYGITCTGGAVSSVNLGAYTVTDKVHTFGIVVDGTTRVKFYVDGLLAGALTTNIPASGSVNFGMYGSSAASNVGAGILSDIAITQSTVASPSSNGGIFGGMQTLPTTGLKLGADVDLGNAVDSSDDSIWSWDLGATTLQRSFFLNTSGVYQQTANPSYNAIAAGTGTLQSNMFIYNGYAYIANILVAGPLYDLRFTVIRLTDGNNMGETNAMLTAFSVANEPVASICCSADGYIYVTTQAVPGVNAAHVNKAQITGVLVVGAPTQTVFTRALDFGGNQSWVSYKKTSVTDNFFLMVSYYNFVTNTTLDEAFTATDSRVLFMGTTSTNKTIVGVQPYVGAYTPLNSLVVYLLDTVGKDTGTTYDL